MLTHLFTTPLSYQRLELPPGELTALCDYLLALRAAGPGERRSNRGGWHSEGNLFDPAQHRQFVFLHEAVTQAALGYFGEAMAFRGEAEFAITGWAVINGPGDTNDPHHHSPNLLSGALYVRVPQGMSGGEIVFLDPRLNLSSQSSDAMRRMELRPPWEIGSAAHAPQTGDLLIFPSWLMHHVRAFHAPEDDAVRIVMSFNVAA